MIREGERTKKCMREKKTGEKRCWKKKERMGEQNKVAKKEQASSRGGQGGMRGLLCGDWRVTGVPIEWPEMTVPLENASYADGVALMEPEKGCSCLPWRRDIVQLDKAA